ncbi:DMT family transporter [Streptococcus hillyeri]|uniref:EamA family transporter n=1 Tax=Streptococcus hillyeri TaxID=2282420 RepID=A0A3L9DV19_9STRE|nr:DMT family transporter [Streptococcus hillyeri]RLY03783.1 EamA family transporter [Streptococcus hillyeri]
MSKALKGSLMVVIAGIAWGISGVSGQYLMANGVHVNLLTSLRLLVSGIALTGLAFMTQRERLMSAMKRKDVWLGIALFSLFGLLLNQYAYLSAIHYTNAGTATVLQYLTPVLILAVVCLKGRVMPTVGELSAIILAILGTYIIATHGQWTSLAMTPKGLFWGLLSAVTYALYILIPARLIRKLGSLIVIGPGMLLSGIFFPVAVQAWRYELTFSTENVLALIGIVGIGTIFAYTVFLKGTTIVGAVKGSLLASVEPIASVVFGILIMKETFYLIDLLGMLLILLAVFLISLKDLYQQKRHAAPKS